MSRLSFALVLMCGLLAGGLGSLLLRPAPAPIGADDVRAIFSDMLATEKSSVPAVAQIDASQIDTLVENYLMSDPSILQRMSDKLAETKRVAERAALKDALDKHYADIYDDTGNVILGNPKGDVTLVEMFDYNCTFCKGALPDLAALMAEDHNLKVILKQFPILSSGSIDAARVAVLVNQNPNINYWDFHQKLFASRGEVGAGQALQVAEQMGGNRAELMLDMNGKHATEAIQASYKLAQELNVGGTPTYILGDELIPGAMPIDQIRQKIANLRKCGSTVCTDPAG